MNDIRERFTLECRTNKSTKVKIFKPNSINKEMYKHWKADSNVMMRDAILANKVGISYPRQLELIHGSIERILKSLIIRKYGLEVPVHETRVIYDAIKEDLPKELNQIDYNTLKLLDSKYILDRYPVENRFYSEEMIEMGFEVLLNINRLVEDSLELSKRAKKIILEVEEQLSIIKED